MNSSGSVPAQITAMISLRFWVPMSARSGAKHFKSGSTQNSVPGKDGDVVEGSGDAEDGKGGLRLGLRLRCTTWAHCLFCGAVFAPSSESDELENRPFQTMPSKC